ncbi:MAG: hypothetical protein GF393_10165, partial [Armatimonadia bacterium]|nr:hypothetical protein [Armatimonadia bacterium]
MTKQLMTIALMALIAGGVCAQEIQTGELLFSDDFARFTETTTEIGEAWGKVVTPRDGEPMENLARGTNGALWIGYASGKVNTPGVFLREPQVSDGVIELTVGPSTMGERPHTSIISYRAPSGEAAGHAGSAGAYHLWLVNDWSGSRDIVLRYGDQRLAAADIADEHDPRASYRVRIALAGAHHTVSVDGEQVIDFWDWHAGHEGAGYIGFGGYYSQGTFDDFALHEALSEADGPAIDTSNGRIPPLVYQGRPFIPLGTYDRPREHDTDDWLEAGGNCVIIPTFSEALPSEERLAQVAADAEWGAEHGVAMVYFPRIDMFSDWEGEGQTVTRPEEIPPKVALLNEMMTVTADHPNTLGYWTFDEPENHVYRAYGQWEERKDQGLAEWMAEGLRWTYETLKQSDPDAYVMPTIAWWTTYEGLAPIYDVNVPNTYAGGDDRFTVVYDCALAADAIRATDAHSFVFMPPCYDSPDWPLHSIPEMRYSYIAPFTQGAMGILAWRLGRASEAYRQAVIYPVMSEVKRLLPWLHGEWHDDLVTSDHDTATAEYLK